MTKKASSSYSLAELASLLNATLAGDGECRVSGLSTLTEAGPNDIAFLANKAYAKYLATTQAAAVLLHPDYVDECPVSALVLDNPYLGYARLSHCFDPLRRDDAVTMIHASAVVHESAVLGECVFIGPHAVIEAGVQLGNGVHIGANCFVGADSALGDKSYLHAGVVIYHGVVIGERAILHSGAVIGGDGFGFAHDGQGWHKIAQLGGVVLGNDVEVGSCTSIDRGALGDTVIGHDVKIDSQVQIAHNVHIGDHSALAGCVGVAGSTRVGQHCLLGGGVGLAGHIDIADRVQVTGMSLVTNSITDAGVYSSGTGSMPNAQWRRNAVRFKQLDELSRRVRALERSQN
ncbi:UDP-3-O-(3-hydroxymyristoyl)glucosamine N-acyltransferase [Larsenimonas rhizosphaerae]|uniref:UDP-3-O-(3-hydroxymyristoyl)glucosamine N-acyltransferase n=1 Tax=Larsenimonas rhizosphaerae TaxID=2944682 RepID=UPI0020343724|nr:UDP-3-O-(3-hydroxymyristoyl)glucosamine N-acyltransferase [Larsenimonas rhizosphaerae]MCM2129672.1 UDP-3-O-(3-hydroxymyristoyl)glucosamine N-acyltransferase [Larsenimonas rhizosphaerae]